MPDTGTLRGDLSAYATRIANGLATPGAEAIVRAMAAVSGSPTAQEHAARLWARELGRAEEVVTRAVARGEASDAIDAHLVVELLIAPIYLRVLLTGEPVDTDFLKDLVEVVVAASASSSAGA